MRSVGSAPNFSKNQTGQSPSGIAPAVLSHAQAVEQNYKLVMEADRWAENGDRRDLLHQQTERYADILERFGVRARLDRVVTAVGASTGGIDWAEGFRNTNVLPLVASRNRRTVLRDLQYWMMHVARRPIRYAVVTFGATVDLFGPLPAVHVLGDGTLVDRDGGVILYRPPSYDDLCRILDIDGVIERAASIEPKPKSLWQQLRDITNPSLMAPSGIEADAQEWPADYFINDDDINFFSIEAADGEWDIPF